MFLGLNLYDKFKPDLYKIVRNYVYSDSYYPDTYSGLVIAGFRLRLSCSPASTSTT